VKVANANVAISSVASAIKNTKDSASYALGISYRTKLKGARFTKCKCGTF
jgi:hypothetical protein